MSEKLKRLLILVMLAVVTFGLATCKKETVAPPEVEVFEGAITINQTSAGVAAEVTDQGGAEVTSRGFVYGISGGAVDTIYCGSGTGVYSAELNGLQPNTQYVYEAFAKNAGGTGTSGKYTFTTQDIMLPTVETGDVENVGTTTAVCGGNVTYDGGASFIERGVCWGTEHNPTIGDSFAAEGQGMGEYSCTMRNLMGNTTYYVRAYAKNSKGTAYGEEKHFTTLDYDLPEVTTADITDIAQTTAKGGGEVISDGGTIVTERGICWGSSHNPTIHNHKVEAGQGLGGFDRAFSGMSAHTKYYVRAYATNSRGTAYGNEVSFTTLADLPTVSTRSVTNITTTTAKGRGTVVIDGGAPVTERGICWGSSHNPTVANHCSSGGMGTGEYTVDMTGLQPHTTYYARAFATNSSGTQYGDEVSFSTLAVSVPGVTTSVVTNIGRTSASCGGSVNSDGGADVTERGVCWGTSHNPTISGQHIPSGSGLGDFTCSITGLSVNTTYYVRAYAKNSKGTAYGEERSFATLDYDLPEVTTAEISEIGQTTAKGGGNVTSSGGTDVTERGICWGSSHNPTIHNHKVPAGQGLGSFTCNWSGMNVHAKYYVRAYATNSRGTAYGNEVSFTTLADRPTVSTGRVTNVTATTATGSGNVISDGGAPVSERGICWGTGHNPTVSGSHHSNGTGTGNYPVDMTGLASNTTYYVRAYAKNSQGTAYGDEVDFRTSQAPTYTVSISVNPSDGGTVSGAGSYGHGESCTLTATANAGYSFVNWTKNGTQVSTNASYTFTVTEAGEYVAHFSLNNYNITATANPSAGGTVSGAGTYNHGVSCTLTATASTGYTFTNWTENGNVVSTNANYTFNVTGNRTLVANFALNTYTITASANPSNGGTVSGAGAYNHGASCTLSATANTGYTFVKWTKNGSQVSTSANYTFTVTEAGEYVAHFSLNSYNVNATANPSNGGTVSGAGTYNHGASCTLTATANTGYTFTNWTENGTQVSTNPSYTFTIEGGRNLVANFTVISYSITVSANPSNGGTALGGGTYTYGQNCTLTATAATGYTFVKWTKNGTQVSTNASYPFVVTASASYVAHFQANSYTIIVTASPSAGGMVSGGGIYTYSQLCTVHATVNSGYAFTNWTVNGSQVSTDASYTFRVTGNCTLTANFTYIGGGNAPTGAINGVFSVSASQRVYFSQGNLQYRASTNTWRFAESQLDYRGSNNANISPSYSDWIDLFGWGTSGWNCGNTYYRPCDSNNSDGSLYGPPGQYNLTGSYASSDWGRYNAISNGGNTSNTWRTLTQSEWDYVFNTRSTSSGIRYAKAQVNNVNGVILLPDNWSSSYYTLYSTNQGGVSFSSNIIGSSTWTNSLQPHGAVFLPAAGRRYGSSVYNVGTLGYYWSASYNSSDRAWGVNFGYGDLNTNDWNDRYVGRSVRLVCPAQ